MKAISLVIEFDRLNLRDGKNSGYHVKSSNYKALLACNFSKYQGNKVFQCQKPSFLKEDITTNITTKFVAAVDIVP
jgi:hypothetical protein